MKVLAAAAVAVVGLTMGLAAGPAGASKSANLAQAKKALLVRSDLPKGWKSSKSSGSDTKSFPGESQLASCIGVPVTTVALNPPMVNSPDFDNKTQTLIVEDSVAVFPSTTTAAQQYAAMANPKTPGCMANILNGPEKSTFDKSFGVGATVGPIAATDEPTTAYAPHTTPITLTFTVIYKGVTVPVRLTQVFFVKGKEGQQLGLTSLGGGFPASLSEHLTSVAVGRL